MARALATNRNLSVRVALALFVVLATSFYLAGGLAAKYVSTDNNDDGARAAGFTFNLADSGDSRVVDLTRDIKVPGASADYVFTVSNSSEVSQRYRLSVELNGSMPVAVEVREGSSYSSDAKLVLQSSVKELDCKLAVREPLAKSSKYYTVAPNVAASQSFTLRATWPKLETANGTTTSYDVVDYANGAVGVLTVRAVAEQVD